VTSQLNFLTLQHVLRLHRRCLEEHGGQAGVRDMGLVQAAIAMPQAGFGGQLMHPDLASQAAAYMFHLCKNHGFIDGNKRVAVAAAEAFLFLNGHEYTQDDERLEQLVLQVASGTIEKAQLIDQLGKPQKLPQP
jgi:death-on-curing protein